MNDLDNWSFDPLCNTKFGTFISEDDFWKVQGSFHLSNNDNPASRTDLLHKISKFHSEMEERWNKYYSKGIDLTLDEGMIPFKGRLSFLQYMKGKPTRWGIKAFLLSSSKTGYTYRMQIYTGKNKERTSIQNVVEKIVEPLQHKGHILYFDNFYTSIPLLKSLRKKEIRCTGTIRENRIRNKELVNGFKKSQEGDVKFYTNSPDQDLMLTMWKDKRRIYFLSNHRDSSIDTEEIEEGDAMRIVQTPSVRNHYIKKCRGVDLANHLYNTFRYDHTQRKWWMTIFEEIMQITLSNIYIIHNYLSKKPLKRLEFHLEIIRYLAYDVPLGRPLKLTHYCDWVPQKKKIIEEIGIGNTNNIKKDFRLRCKKFNCNKKSDLYCVGCSTKNNIVALCVPDCFNAYHSLSLS